jgi:hypothetical protein
MLSFVVGENSAESEIGLDSIVVVYLQALIYLGVEHFSFFRWRDSRQALFQNGAFNQFLFVGFKSFNPNLV